LTVLAPGSEVHLADLPPELAGAQARASDADWAQALAGWAERHVQAGSPPLLDAAQPQFERVLIRTALKRTQGHRQEAAKLLGWGRNTLTRKLRELGMSGGADADAYPPRVAAPRGNAVRCARQGCGADAMSGLGG